MEKKLKLYKELLNIVLYAQLGGHLNPSKEGKKILDRIRKILSENDDIME